MMAPRTQNGESRRPCSRGSSCEGDNDSQFSMRGQQSAHCSAWDKNSPSSALGFSLGAQLQQHQQASASLCPSQHLVRRSHCHKQCGEHELATLTTLESLQEFPFGLGQGYDLVSATQGMQETNVNALQKANSDESLPLPDASPQALINALSVVQEKIQQLQAVAQLIAQGDGQSVARHQEVAAGVVAVISQLVVAAAGMLKQTAAPKNQTMATVLQLNGQFERAIESESNLFQQSGFGNFLCTELGNSCGNAVHNFGTVGETVSMQDSMGGSNLMGGGAGGSALVSAGDRQNLRRQGMNSPYGTSHTVLDKSHEMLVASDENLGTVSSRVENGAGNHLLVHSPRELQGNLEENDTEIGVRDEDIDGEGESLPPGSYELVEMDAVEILAEHTHFCEICGKGFKRDANLRMHMRGHGDEYKTAAALARPDKCSHGPSVIRPRRYSCPCMGCKRNKKHDKFQPLKTVLCVKNHYRRSHCPKMFNCSKCKAKTFSVVADLKTHEKHCGRDKWQCSCGTTFSRKDKLFGHIGLFAGHTPALPSFELEGSGGVVDSATNGSHGFTSGNRPSSSSGDNPIALLAGSGGNDFFQGNGLVIGAAMAVENVSVIEVGNGTGIGGV
eukprot:c24881_g1_i1 orf=310-2157(+)